MVAVVGLDDTRYDDDYGSFVIQFLRSIGRSYNAHGTSLGPCWTSRTEWFTGLSWPRHCFNPTLGFSATTEYTQTYDQGAKRISLGRPSQWAGPYNNSLGAILGLPDTRVSQADQLALGVTRPVNPGDTPDDLQRTSGTIFQEVARYDVPVCYLLKYNNQHRASNNIPAGITKAHIQIVGNETGGQYDADLQEYEGPNAFDGLGVSSPTTNHYSYDRGGISNIGNFSSFGGGRVRISTTQQHKYVADDIGKFVVVVDGNTAIPQYNGVWKLVAIGTNPDGSAPTNTQCWFECPTDYGTTTTGAGKLYNKTEMPIYKAGEWAEEFIDDCVANNTGGLLWICPHQTHSTNGETPTGYGSAIEKEFEGTIDPNDGPAFNGIAGAWCDTADPSHPVDVQQVWEYNLEQMKTVSVFLTNLVNKLEAAKPGNWYLILTADQGIQNGEQWTRGNNAVKSAIWEGSRRSFMIIVGPGVTPGSTFDRPTMHADIPATILTMFGFRANHMLTSRDGVSLLDIVDPSHPAYDRIIPNFGDYFTGSGQSFLTKDGLKFVRQVGNPSSGKMFQYRLPPDGDYETTEITPSTSDLSDYNDLMDELINFQFNNITDSCPLNDGSIVL